MQEPQPLVGRTDTETSQDIRIFATRANSEDCSLAESEQKDLREVPLRETCRLTLTYRHALLIVLPTLTQKYFRFTLTLTHKDSKLHSHTFPVLSI